MLVVHAGWRLHQLTMAVSPTTHCPNPCMWYTLRPFIAVNTIKATIANTAKYIRFCSFKLWNNKWCQCMSSTMSIACKVSDRKINKISVAAIIVSPNNRCSSLSAYKSSPKQLNKMYRFSPSSDLGQGRHTQSGKFEARENEHQTNIFTLLYNFFCLWNSE